MMTSMGLTPVDDEHLYLIQAAKLSRPLKQRRHCRSWGSKPQAWAMEVIRPPQTIGDLGSVAWETS